MLGSEQVIGMPEGGCYYQPKRRRYGGWGRNRRWGRCAFDEFDSEGEGEDCYDEGGDGGGAR